MTKDVNQIRNSLVEMLKAHIGPLKVTSDTYENFEVSGTLEVMQGSKKVDGIYFCSIVPKPKDVRFYFFPVYTHQDKVGKLPENLQKALKGKSCFHIKQMDDDLKSNIKALINKSVKIYQEEGLLSK